MNNLEKRILDNRNEFNHAEPPEGHFQRFKQRLDQQRSRRKIVLPSYLRIAAVVAIISVSSIFIYEYFRSGSYAGSHYSFGMLSKEYQEVEDYFIQTINAKYSELEKFNFEDPDQKEIILKELREMDILYKRLQEDFKNDPNNQRIIHAMILHYQQKIEIMNNIVIQLEEINSITSNLKSHEKEI